MDALTRYSRKWSLTAPHVLAQTATSTVYRVVQDDGTFAVLKLLNAVGIRDEQRGAIALRHFDCHGAARLLHASDDAHLLEYLDGGDLVALVDAGRDDDAARIIADVVRRLHTVTPEMIPDGLHSLRRRFRSLMQRATDTVDPLLKHGAQVAEGLLANPKNEIVLHGDIHHENIRQGRRGWLAYDPKGVYGESTYDVANALLNPAGRATVYQDDARFLRQAQMYADALGTSQQRVIAFAFAHTCLSISWSIEDAEDYGDAFVAAQMMEKHVN